LQSYIVVEPAVCEKIFPSTISCNRQAKVSAFNPGKYLEAVNFPQACIHLHPNQKLQASLYTINCDDAEYKKHEDAAAGGNENA
jgi:hypothetical protein